MALAATILYGTQSVVIKTWLTDYSAAVLLTCFYGTGMAIALSMLASQAAAGKPVVFPAGLIMYCAIAAGAAYCIADFFMIGSLRLATSVAVTSILLLTPVFAGVGTYLIVRLGHTDQSLLPNRYEVLTFVLIVVTLAVFQKSQEVRGVVQQENATQQVTTS